MNGANTVFMFSGQGSQYFQMGQALFERNSTFRDHMLRLDATARELSGSSVVAAIYSPSRNKSATFDRTLLTHPAIFMVEYATAQALMDAGVMPDITLGVSLGSFAAAAVAGFIGVEDALSAIIGQARALEACCKQGAMIAILANPALHQEEFLACRSELAAVNFASHFVVAARMDECAAIEAGLHARSITWQRLPVAFAFHSRWIDAAQPTFDSFMKSVELRRGNMPLACCSYAQLLTSLPAGYFWTAARGPIRFQETIAHLERAGAYRYVDAGPSGTLATFLKYCLPNGSASTVRAVITRNGRDPQSWTAVTGSEL